MAHIPDGFLSASVSAGTFATAGAVAAYAGRQARAQLDHRAAPTLGLATAAVFAAQAVNFPVMAGTSGHLLGGVLLAVLFGPWSAFLVMTAVLIAQALIFADGGLTALGANVANIAGMGTLVGYAIYRGALTLLGAGRVRRGLAAGLAGYLATLLTGLAAGAELGWSGVAPMHLAMGAMATVHAVIGLAEGAITGLVVWSVAHKRPELLVRRYPAPAPGRARALVGLGIVTILGGVLAIIASTAPDGLERAAIDLGFAEAASPWEGAPLAGYQVWLPGTLGTALGVILGIVFVFIGAAAVGQALTGLRGRREL